MTKHSATRVAVDKIAKELTGTTDFKIDWSILLLIAEILQQIAPMILEYCDITPEEVSDRVAAMTLWQKLRFTRLVRARARRIAREAWRDVGGRRFVEATLKVAREDQELVVGFYEDLAI